MSGTYMGKNWDSIEYIMSLYEIQDPRIVFRFMKMYEIELVNYRAQEAEKRRKAEERKAKSAGGGKTYTHNVKG